MSGLSSIISYFRDLIIGSFMMIDSNPYRVYNIQPEKFKFGGNYDVVLRVVLEDNKKKTIHIFFTETTYWLQGNQNAQKAISELKYEVIADMTDEKFYLREEFPYVGVVGVDNKFYSMAELSSMTRTQMDFEVYGIRY